MRVSKKKLKTLIDPFLYEKLDEDFYEIENVKALSLLTWNRLDLAFKLLYLDLKKKNLELANKIYYYDIFSQTQGKFSEFGNDDKNSLEKYINSFEGTFKDISLNGFDGERTLIPLANNNSILNGSHRTAISIQKKISVKSVNLLSNPLIANYKYFYERKVPIEILDLVVNKFIEYSDNTYIAFLWPSGKGNSDLAEAKFSNVIYKKEINLLPQGAENLIIELYKHMEWIGDDKNNFKGAKEKLIECFPEFKKFKVIAFQAENLEKVREIKEEVRKIHKIGFSSIHITDTKEEAIRISELIFNKSGLHFLNYAKPYRFNEFLKKTDQFRDFIKDNKIESNEIYGSVLVR